MEVGQGFVRKGTRGSSVGGEWGDEVTKIHDINL